MKNVDDDEYFELVAREHGLNTDSYWNARQDLKSFYRENRKSIELGETIVKKLLK